MPLSPEHIGSKSHPKYQQKFKCISSPEQNYLSLFAMRYPVLIHKSILPTWCKNRRPKNAFLPGDFLVSIRWDLRGGQRSWRPWLQGEICQLLSWQRGDINPRKNGPRTAGYGLADLRDTKWSRDRKEGEAIVFRASSWSRRRVRKRFKMQQTCQEPREAQLDQIWHCTDQI